MMGGFCVIGGRIFELLILLANAGRNCMEHPFSRTELLLGENCIQKLHDSRVAVFGVGGVGGYLTEALARSVTFVPSVVGLMIAGEVVRDLTGMGKEG